MHFKALIQGQGRRASCFHDHFTFSDPGTRSLLFYNGFFDLKKSGKEVRIWAFWQDAAGSWREEKAGVGEDWSDYEFVGLCRDVKNQRAQDLILIVSNGEFAPQGGKLTAAKAPYLKRSSMGCFRYQGTLQMNHKHRTWSGLGRTISADVAFEFDATDNLDATYPDLPHTKRVGFSSLIRPKGGSYTYTADWTTGCRFVAGPATFPIVDYRGVLQTNPFPELKSTDATLQQWHQQPARAYTGALGDDRMVTLSVSGPGCSGTELDLVGTFLVTNDIKNGIDIGTPIAAANGDLINTFAARDQTFTWTLKPQAEP